MLYTWTHYPNIFIVHRLNKKAHKKKRLNKKELQLRKRKNLIKKYFFPKFIESFLFSPFIQKKKSHLEEISRHYFWCYWNSVITFKIKILFHKVIFHEFKTCRLRRIKKRKILFTKMGYLVKVFKYCCSKWCKNCSLKSIVKTCI